MRIDHLIKGVELHLANDNILAIATSGIVAVEAATHEEWRISVDKATLAPVSAPTYDAEVVLKLTLRVPLADIQEDQFPELASPRELP